jgi:hypothetical protein
VVLLAALLTGCGGSPSRSRTPNGARTRTGTNVHRSDYYARRPLAVGRLPNGQGFGIWAQRWRFKGRDYVQLIAATAAAAPSMRKIRQELDQGQYGSTEENVDQLPAPVALSGILACGRHPVVLLYGLVREPVSTAVLHSAARIRPFELVAIPSDLGVRGVLGYGFLSGVTTLQMKSPTGKLLYSEVYPGPPSDHGCAGGPESIIYAVGK